MTNPLPWSYGAYCSMMKSFFFELFSYSTFDDNFPWLLMYRMKTSIDQSDGTMKSFIDRRTHICSFDYVTRWCIKVEISVFYIYYRKEPIGKMRWKPISLLSQYDTTNDSVTPDFSLDFIMRNDHREIEKFIGDRMTFDVFLYFFFIFKMKFSHKENIDPLEKLFSFSRNASDLRHM